MYRDEALDQSIAGMLAAYENQKPRNSQRGLGPSDLGGCREYVRNIIVDTPKQAGSDEWPAASAIGTLVGTYLEKVVTSTIEDAASEVRVTTTLPGGLTVTGHADIVIPSKNAVWDGKSKPRLIDVEAYGPSDDYFIQISVYALGLVQAGILQEGCTATLVYLGRSGEDSGVRTYTIDWEEIQSHVALAVQRLDDVMDAQEQFEATGETAPLHALRDKTPAFCFHKRVLCPFRDACWKGSDAYPTTDDAQITDPELAESVRVYAEAREAEKDQKGLKDRARDALRGISGITPDGHVVNWTARGAISVQKVK